MIRRVIKNAVDVLGFDLFLEAKDGQEASGSPGKGNLRTSDWSSARLKHAKTNRDRGLAKNQGRRPV